MDSARAYHLHGIHLQHLAERRFIALFCRFHILVDNLFLLQYGFSAVIFVAVVIGIDRSLYNIGFLSQNSFLVSHNVRVSC